MSQFPNDRYFTSLLNTFNSQHSSSSNPSTPSSQSSIFSSQYQQYPPFGTQYNMPKMTPEQIYQQQQQAFQNQQLNNQFQNLQYQRNAPPQSFHPKQSQPQYFQPQQSQSQSRFEEPQPPTKENHEQRRKGKRMAKRSKVDLDADDEEDQSRQVQRWTREEEILLCKCWVDVFENNHIGADRSEYSFWGQITDDFNQGTYQGTRTKNMITGKWYRINGDCQKFNVVYKHLDRKSGENEADHIETAKTNFSAQSKGRTFLLEHAWCV
ncbi:hypothetical protein Tco_0480375 [Tanacetum coccineum]